MNEFLAHGRHGSAENLLDPLDVDKEILQPDERVTRPQSIKSHPLSLWVLGITLACTVLNLTLLWNGTGVVPLRASLSRPSTYMGLSKITRNLTEESSLQFSTYPQILTQISPRTPTRVWPDDTKQELRKVGTISPDARRFWVSAEISSVAQFRAIDYGFESCSLSFNLHAMTELDLRMNLEPVVIKVWVLEQSSRIDVKRLSWSTRPQRKRLLDTVRLSNNSVTKTRSIDCPWDSFPAFEFTCEECLVDFWQDPKVSDLGVTMVQRSSLVQL